MAVSQAVECACACGGTLRARSGALSDKGRAAAHHTETSAHQLWRRRNGWPQLRLLEPYESQLTMQLEA